MGPLVNGHWQFGAVRTIFWDMLHNLHKPNREDLGTLKFAMVGFLNTTS